MFHYYLGIHRLFGLILAILKGTMYHHTSIMYNRSILKNSFLKTMEYKHSIMSKLFNLEHFPKLNNFRGYRVNFIIYNFSMLHTFCENVMHPRHYIQSVYDGYPLSWTLCVEIFTALCSTSICWHLPKLDIFFFLREWNVPETFYSISVCWTLFVRIISIQLMGVTYIHTHIHIYFCQKVKPWE